MNEERKVNGYREWRLQHHQNGNTLSTQRQRGWTVHRQIDSHDWLVAPYIVIQFSFSYCPANDRMTEWLTDCMNSCSFSPVNWRLCLSDGQYIDINTLPVGWLEMLFAFAFLSSFLLHFTSAFSLSRFSSSHLSLLSLLSFPVIRWFDRREGKMYWISRE